MRRLTVTGQTRTNKTDKRSFDGFVGRARPRSPKVRAKALNAAPSKPKNATVVPDRRGTGNGSKSAQVVVTNVKPIETRGLTEAKRVSVQANARANATLAMSAFGDPMEMLDYVAVMNDLNNSFKQLRDDDLRGCEEMLLGQAQALQWIFTNLARKATEQRELRGYETIMRLAFKAQNQCRMTLETLANIKNPPVLYARQANITNGPQQVNNGIPSAHDPRARSDNSKFAQNELLERVDGQRLDSIAANAASGSDTTVATVG